MVLIAILLALLQQQHRFFPVKREVVERRVNQFKGGNSEREATLKGLFEESHCSGEQLVELPVRFVKAPNLQCTLQGATDSIIVVGAHFDFVSFGSGVVDNWSGASLLPSLYESLAENHPKHTFVFVGFTYEEGGLVGSKDYVKQLTPKDRERIRAMINLDTLGLSPTKVWASHADKELLRMLAEIASATKLPIAALNFDKVGSTDSESFAEAHIPALTIHSVTQQTWPILHSPRDRMDALNMDDYYQTYRLVAAFLSYLDWKLN